jgi:hypothetical protein
LGGGLLGLTGRETLGSWPKGQIAHTPCVALRLPMGGDFKLDGLSIAQLRKCALYIQAVATAAAPGEERAVMDRLAHRFRVLALEKSAALSLQAPALPATEKLPQPPTAGFPSSAALQTAIEVLRQDDHVPGTIRHPVIVSRAIGLAYLLSAYRVAQPLRSGCAARPPTR